MKSASLARSWVYRPEEPVVRYSGGVLGGGMPTRGSDKHSPRVDDALDDETDGLQRAGRSPRAQEERETEPTVTDDGIPATPDASPIEDEENTTGP